MSAERAVLTELDQDAGTATIEREISLDELFDEDDRFVLLEDEHGWCGYERERNGDGWLYHWIDNRRPETAWNQSLVVSPRSIFETVRQHLSIGRPIEPVQEGER